MIASLSNDLAIMEGSEERERIVVATRAALWPDIATRKAKGTSTDEHVVGYYNTGDRMKYWGKIGAFCGGFWGLLFGSAALMISGIGPPLVAGPLEGELEDESSGI